MLKVLYQKLRLSSKGNLNYNNYSNLSKLQIRGAGKLHTIGRYIVQGIPVLSIFALVGIINYVINPDLINIKLSSATTCSAAEGCEVFTGCSNGYIEKQDENGCFYCEEIANLGANPSALLVIDNNKIKDTILVTQGDFAYATHKISVQASDIEDYALTITGSTNLTPPSGGSTISGAGGKTVANMTNNTWGYAWGNVGMDERSAIYNSLTPSGNNLRGDNVTDNATDWSRQLAFGAKFANDAVDGKYTTEVTLSLIVTPKKNTLDNLQTMQQMTADICEATNTGTSKALTDIRDDSIYTVAKLSDGNCWMTQNLALNLNGTTLTSTNSNVTTTWQSDTGVSAAWPADINICRPATASSCYKAKFYNGSASTKWKDDYGYYYSWTAATAGTGIQNASGDVTDSICPSGWMLPSRTDYEQLLTASKIANNAAGSTTLRQPPYNFVLSGIVDTNTQNNGGIYDIGVSGALWTKTTGTYASQATVLYINESNVTIDSINALAGKSVRCIATKAAN